MGERDATTKLWDVTCVDYAAGKFWITDEPRPGHYGANGGIQGQPFDFVYADCPGMELGWCVEAATAAEAAEKVRHETRPDAPYYYADEDGDVVRGRTPSGGGLKEADDG